MTQLVQLIYVSRSTFATSENFKGIEPNVGRILLKSRINNKSKNITGVMYFGDGCFFQCLEGDVDAVDTLFESLKNDPRHSDVQLLSRNAISERSFAGWEMKFVPLEEPMTRLLQSRGYKSFDPFRFDGEMVKSVLAFLGSATVADSA
jgi:Sensors of blue-light using FAD